MKFLTKASHLLAFVTEQKKRVVNISFYLFASMIQLFVGLATSPLISKTLSHRDFAIVGYFNSFLTLLTPLIGLMLGSYYARTYFRVQNKEREVLRNTIVSLLLSYGAVSTLVSCLLFLVFLRLSEPGFPFFPYTVLSFGTVVFGQIYNFYLLNLRLTKRAKQYFLVSLYHHLFYGFMMILLCVVYRYGAAGSLGATLITSILFSVVFLKSLLTKFQIERKTLKPIFQFCWPLIVAGVLQYFFSGVDRALLATLRDDTNLGLYSVAFRITSYIGVFYAAISMTIEPDIYQSLAQRKYRKLALLMGLLIGVKLAIVLVFNWLAPFVVNILTAGRYNDAVQYARILSFKNVSSSIYSSMSLIIIGLGYSKVTLVNRVIGTIGVFAMYKVLISNYGFIGAAWGQVASFLILSLFSFMFLAYKALGKKDRARVS